jgi:RNA polymerase sigma-70 factor, ECF subfamily
VAAVALIAGSRDAAEDAVQEALARAWERDATETIRSLPAWVTRVALNLSKSRWRRLRNEARAVQRLDASSDETFPEARSDIERALRELPRRQREATVLRYYLGYDVTEIADAMGVSAGTVKTQLFRARRALAELLGESDQEEVDGPARLR